MKPTKNHYYCPACQHQKMLFARKKEALLLSIMLVLSKSKLERDLLGRITALIVAVGT